MTFIESQSWSELVRAGQSWSEQSQRRCFLRKVNNIAISNGFGQRWSEMEKTRKIY